MFCRKSLLKDVNHTIGLWFLQRKFYNSKQLPAILTCAGFFVKIFCGFLKVMHRTAYQPSCWKKLERLEKNFKLHTRYLIFSGFKNCIPKWSTIQQLSFTQQLWKNGSNWTSKPCLLHTKNENSFMVRESVMTFEWIF